MRPWEEDVFGSSSNGERGEYQQDGPQDVQAVFLFGSGLAPAPGMDSPGMLGTVAAAVARVGGS